MIDSEDSRLDPYVRMQSRLAEAKWPFGISDEAAHRIHSEADEKIVIFRPSIAEAIWVTAEARKRHVSPEELLEELLDECVTSGMKKLPAVVEPPF